MITLTVKLMPSTKLPCAPKSCLPCKLSLLLKLPLYIPSCPLTASSFIPKTEFKQQLCGEVSPNPLGLKNCFASVLPQDFVRYSMMAFTSLHFSIYVSAMNELSEL